MMLVLMLVLVVGTPARLPLVFVSVGTAARVAFVGTVFVFLVVVVTVVMIVVVLLGLFLLALVDLARDFLG